MAVKTITFSLNSASIGNAIKELKKFRDEFERKCEQLRKKVAEHIRWSAEQGFSNALVSDVVYGEAPLPEKVSVYWEDNGNVTTVFADGKEAIFIEFGAGVYHNGDAGTSPHPWGAEQGYLIGTYGLGHGTRDAWGYYSEPAIKSGLVVTRGTPAAMPMFRGVESAIRTFDALVKEVFG